MADNCKLCEWSLPSDKEGPCVSIPATEDAEKCPDFWPIGKDEDTLEKVALDMWEWIDGVTHKRWTVVPGDVGAFRARLKALGVVVDA